MSSEMTVGEIENLSKDQQDTLEYWCEKTNEWKPYDVNDFIKRGFPKPETSEFPVNAITVHDMYLDRYAVFATGEYVPKDGQVTFHGFPDEESLLKGFVRFIDKERPHIITGWNVNSFDIHYLVNRIEKVLGKSWMQKLSPEREVKKHSTFDDEGREMVQFSFKGTIIWDYMELYKKFIKDPRESYSLDFICRLEVKEGKMSYEGKLSDLYVQDFERFIDYNIWDCTLIKKLNDKLHLIEVALSIMHTSRCVPDSVFGTVAPWDAIFYNFLLSKKKFCPAVKQNVKQDFPGGWVDLPVPGFYKWLAVEDIVSSYPCQIRSFNISPETILEDSQLSEDLLALRVRFDTVEKFLDLEALKEITLILRKHGVSFSANGSFFKTDVEGFIPEAYTILFNKRIALKKEMKRLKRSGDPSWKSLDISQHALKILLNSGYGAMSNVWFRYFDIRMASAITLDGQVCKRGVGNYLEKKYPMLKNVYGDTDSCFITLDEIVKKRFGTEEPSKRKVLDFLLKFNETVLEPNIKAYFDEVLTAMNVREPVVFMEAECIADASIISGKKRYILNKVWDEGDDILDDPKQKVRGVEIIQTSTPEWVREKLREAVRLIFETGSNDRLMEHIADTRKAFFDQPFEKVAFTRSCNFSGYNADSKSLPIQVRASFMYNMALERFGLTDNYVPIHDGDKVKYCYTKTPNPLGSNVFGMMDKFPDELRTVFVPDYETQFEKTFENPMTKLLTSIGWSYARKSSMEDLFGD
jgi:DNA polymerase elongation subunit (family B)